MVSEVYEHFEESLKINIDNYYKTDIIRAFKFSFRRITMPKGETCPTDQDDRREKKGDWEENKGRRADEAEATPRIADP